jgi:integrase/recombinase XerD
VDGITPQENDMTVVKLFTRPVVGGRRKWVKANPKINYPEGTVFFLRWLPRGATNYRVRKLEGLHTYKTAMRECLAFEPEELTPVAPKSQPRTLNEFLPAFLHDKRSTRKKDGTPLDPATIKQYGIVIPQFIRIIGRNLPTQITKQDMRDCINTMRETVEHRTVCNLYILVACFLKFCGIDHKNLLPQSERPSPVEHPPEVYTQDEMTKFFFNVVDERDSLAFEFLLKTGARKTEMTYLDWENNLPNLDAPAPTVKFFTKDGFRTKTGKYRDVPLEKELAAKLRAWRKKNPTSYFVFPRQDGRPEDNFLRIAKDVAERAGMDRTKFWLHKFRDTFATWHLRNGADIRTVQHWLGHASIEMTQKYLAPQEGKAAQGLMNATFSQMVTNVVAGA